MTDLEYNLVTTSSSRRSSRRLNPLQPPLPIFEPTTTLLTQTNLWQIPPIRIRIIHRDFLTGLNASTYKNNPLRAQPHKPLELGVGPARVVYEASVVAFAALVDLVALFGFGLHDVHAFEAFCDEAGEFADGDAAFEGLLAD